MVVLGEDVAFDLDDPGSVHPRRVGRPERAVVVMVMVVAMVVIVTVIGPLYAAPVALAVIRIVRLLSSGSVEIT